MFLVPYRVADVKSRVRKFFEVLFVIFVIALSIVIFLMRDKIGQVNDISYLGLFLLCFLANSTILLPAPSLMIAASCALIMNPLLVALTAALGSTLGEFVGYAFGTITKDISPKFKKILDKLTGKIRNQTVLVFIMAVLPLPLFDIVGIYSGGTKMNLMKFSLACFAGKFIKLLVYTKMYDILEWAYSTI